MKREIKFRAWVPADGEESGYIIGGDELAFDGYEPLCDLLSRDGIMQYTGFKDKNDVEIYEGDIVDWNDIHYKVCIGEFGLRDFETESVVDMVYGVHGDPINESVAPFCYQMPINNSWIQHHSIHVIGNIYENADLLTNTVSE